MAKGNAIAVNAKKIFNAKFGKTSREHKSITMKGEKKYKYNKYRVTSNVSPTQVPKSKKNEIENTRVGKNEYPTVLDCLPNKIGMSKYTEHTSENNINSLTVMPISESS